jgi:hypothetical protein
VAWYFCLEWWRKRRGADFDVAEAAVKRRKRGTLTDHTEIDRATVRGAEIIFRGSHQLAAQTGTLALWIHREQT